MFENTKIFLKKQASVTNENVIMLCIISGMFGAIVGAI